MKILPRSAIASFSTCSLVFVALAFPAADAATLVYYRMGDDTSLVTDSSGNGHTLTSSAAVASIPASGDGSAFSDPIPQTGDSNSSMATFNGNQNMVVSDPFGSLIEFTAEAYINLNATSSSTRYVMSQWTTATNGRSWGIGVADNEGGTLTAGANELYLLMGVGSSGTELVPLGLTVALNTDYYIAVAYDGTTDTNDITFYYQNLSTPSSLVSTTISSGISTGINNTSASFRVGAYGSSASSFWNGEIDEVRVSDTILAPGDLLAVPEPSSFALVSGLLASCCIARRRRA